MQPMPSPSFGYDVPQLEFGNLAAHNTSQMHPQYVAGDLGRRSPHYAVDPSSGLRRSPRKARPRISTRTLVSTPAPSIGTNRVAPPATFNPGTIFGAEVTPNTPDYAPAKITAPQQIQAHPFEMPPPKQTHLHHPKSGKDVRRVTGTSDDEVSKLTETMLGEADADLKLETAASGDAAVKLESERGLMDEDHQVLIASVEKQGNTGFYDIDTGGGDGDGDRIAAESWDEEEVEVVDSDAKDNTMTQDGPRGAHGTNFAGRLRRRTSLHVTRYKPSNWKAER
ncbi:hypothetical protein F4604DRAFT_1693303 [Suillus subluteus]|nr:hypothetical protein F4604DRAFT_1693303 [Suillus subluteus]